MKRIKKDFILTLISWSLSLICAICVMIIATKLTEYELFSKVLLLGGAIDAVWSFIILAIVVPYKYHLDKDVERLSRQLRPDYSKEINKEVKNENNGKVD